MDITLYRTKSEPNRLDKVLTDDMLISGMLTDACNALNPTIRLSYNAAIFNKNYAFIPVLGRYYYINNYVIDGDSILLSMHVDVLKTYQQDIKNSVAHINRSSSGNPYIPDPMIVQTANTHWQYKMLGTCFVPGEHYIIGKAGL